MRKIVIFQGVSGIPRYNSAGNVGRICRKPDSLRGTGGI